MTRYLDRALAGETATQQEWNDHMIAFHSAHRRWGENLIGEMLTAGGETSYDLLAAHIKAAAPEAKAILEIGCGDATLLVRIAKLFGPTVALTGIDLVEADIVDARERLPAATFLCGDALVLDMNQKSQDVVTSHLAFLVMPAVEQVLVRARSALREPGLLAFVAEDPLGGGAIFELVGGAIARCAIGSQLSRRPRRDASRSSARIPCEQCSRAPVSRRFRSRRYGERRVFSRPALALYRAIVSVRAIGCAGARPNA